MAQLNDYPLFDSHFHIIDQRFPLIANQGYLPETFQVEDYRMRTGNYHLSLIHISEPTRRRGSRMPSSA